MSIFYLQSLHIITLSRYLLVLPVNSAEDLQSWQTGKNKTRDNKIKGRYTVEVGELDCV